MNQDKPSWLKCLNNLTMWHRRCIDCKRTWVVHRSLVERTSFAETAIRLLSSFDRRFRITISFPPCRYVVLWWCSGSRELPHWFERNGQNKSRMKLLHPLFASRLSQPLDSDSNALYVEMNSHWADRGVDVQASVRHASFYSRRWDISFIRSLSNLTLHRMRKAQMRASW